MCAISAMLLHGTGTNIWNSFFFGENSTHRKLKKTCVIVIKDGWDYLPPHEVHFIFSSGNSFGGIIINSFRNRKYDYLQLHMFPRSHGSSDWCPMFPVFLPSLPVTPGVSRCRQLPLVDERVLHLLCMHLCISSEHWFREMCSLFFMIESFYI